MKTKKIGLFKSHYSIAKSILTLDDPSKVVEDGPQSIVKIALDSSLKEVFLVEDTMNGFLRAYNSFREHGLSLRFGLRLIFCDDISEKNEASLSSNCKYVVFALNSEGIRTLMKIQSEAATDGFYYTPRYDLEKLRKVWHDGLLLAIPFYDSFLFCNSLSFSKINPDFTGLNVVFFLEDNALPFDGILRDSVEKFASGEFACHEAKSIYYHKKEDFMAWQTLKCINERTSLMMPNMDFCSSDRFCFESLMEES